MGNLLQSVKQNPVLWIWNLLSYDNFLVYPMTFFSVTYVHGSHFHIKNVIKSFSSRLSLNGHPALWTGGGVLLDYIRQPCKVQRAGSFVPFWSVNGCKFPTLWSETENGSQENHKSVLKPFLPKTYNVQKFFTGELYQPDLGNVYD